MSLDFIEKWKIKKEFFMGSKAQKGEGGERCITMSFLCLQCKSCIDISLVQSWN